MTSFFLPRPIFAAVCALVIFIAGLVVIPTLPIAQYPAIAPPVVTVTAVYTGADAQTVESSVTTPIEQAINGVNGLRYISSTSGQGISTVTCTFTLGTNLDIAATDVQNAVQTAYGYLPAPVKQIGVNVTKNSGSFVMALALVSNNSKYDSLFLSNYAELNVVNELKRVPGVSNVIIFGQRRYAMRIWIDPRQLAGRGLTVADVINALNEQNVSVAAGSIGSAPESPNQPYTVNVRAEGRLSSPSQFAQIILRSDGNGGFTRLGDVAKIQLGAENYDSFVRFNGNENVIGMGVLQLSTANALSVTSAVRAKLDQLQKSFPAGVHYQIAFDSSSFINESIKDVVLTLLLAIFLVIGVIYLFLQNGRSTLIPSITIPVALIGTFVAMKVLDFSINSITLFGITLAAGLVVDDAIVVIENIERIIRERKLGSFEGAGVAMKEIEGAIVASSLVLLAVFIPVAFFPGTTGEIYKQFAITIAASVAISLFLSLTLAPALSVVLVKFHDREPRFALFRWFNVVLARFRGWYNNRLPKLVQGKRLAVGMFVAALVLTGLLFKAIPTSFIPDEDQGYFIVLIQAPQGTSLAKEHGIALKIEKMIRARPEVSDVFDVGGFSFAGTAPNNGVMFVLLKPWGQRNGAKHSVATVTFNLFMQFLKFPQATVLAFAPPAINGIGSVGGFQFELEDRGNLGLPTLAKTTGSIVAAAAKDPDLQRVFTQFRIDAPLVQVNVDRNKVKAIGGNLGDVYTTLGASLSPFYVNDFDYLDRSYHVYVQAQEQYRDRFNSLSQLFVRGADGGMSPLSAVATVKHVLAPPVINHYDLYRSIELQGTPGAGKSSGNAIAAMEHIFARVAPPGIGYEWTGLTLDEIAAGSLTMIIFGLGIVFVFLVLAALYESWIDPLIVMLAVPAALFGALAFLGVKFIFTMAANIVNFVILKQFVALPAVAQDVYSQVGYVMLIGLAAKNAILIVQFANLQLEQGADVVTAALKAARTRLRPILMTSIAFIIGALPLMFAFGAGSAARQSIGIVVVGGMVVSTFLNLLITPVLYAIIKGWELRKHPAGGNGKPMGPVEEAPEPASAPT